MIAWLQGRSGLPAAFSALFDIGNNAPLAPAVGGKGKLRPEATESITERNPARCATRCVPFSAKWKALETQREVPNRWVTKNATLIRVKRKPRRELSYTVFVNN